MNEFDIHREPNNEKSAIAGIENYAERPPSGTDRCSAELRFLAYFGLSEQPFGVTPDLRFLYLGSKHRQALDVLNFGTELNRGFMTLIAEPGMGKTSVLLQYLEGLRESARTVFLFQTDCDSTELLRYLLAELGIDGKGMDLPEMRSVLSQVLLGEMQAGRRFVLVIDEAQNLDEKVLESIRLLSNFETPWMKLMHIILAGQPELAERLAKPSMLQLRQRVSFDIRIDPLTREEVDHYIDHRLWVAGYKSVPLFSIGARNLIAERSEGIPRNINNICFCAMAYACAMKRKIVDRDTMVEILADMNPGLQIKKEQENPTSKVVDGLKPIALKTPPYENLTVPTATARGWYSKVAVVCLLGFALGLFGFQPNVQKRVQATYDSVSTTIRRLLVPTQRRVSSDAVPNVVPDNSLSSPNLGGASDQGNPKLSTEDTEKSSLGK